MDSIPLAPVPLSRSTPAVPEWMQPRGADGRLQRLESLDLESQQDFTAGFRLMQNQRLRAASAAAFDRALLS